MNFNEFINSDYLKTNPLCGIGTYRDKLNLATGACTRIIKKFVLAGEEPDWGMVENYTYFRLPNFADGIVGQVVCSHYVSPPDAISIYNTVQGIRIQDSSSYGRILIVRPPNFMTETLSGFKTYLQQQYANGTPVTIWYVLGTPTTETITVPSGLSGTEEGYLIQDGTPTPTNPIYPTANTVEKWFGINHYIMGTSTDTLTTLPADLYADGTNATVGIIGNMEQNGTPTPQNPIQPQETGEMTGNLFDTSTLVDGKGLDTNGAIINYPKRCTISVPINVSEFDDVTISFVSDVSNTKVIYALFNGSTLIRRESAIFSGSSIDVSSGNSLYICFYESTDLITVTSDDLSNIIINSGSTALPYEPYGVKIPISSANTTTPVYLGEVQTTRKIKKVVFDGTEDWFLSTAQAGRFGLSLSDYLKSNGTITSFCSHYMAIAQKSGGTVPNNSQYFYSGSDAARYLFIVDTNCSTAADFKSYLAAQYAAGTPVTVWYVLANETTGTVNEPIRKIGDYADAVSGITIPTTAGADSFDVLTTLKPSEVTVNYHGWHPVADVHEYDSNYTITTMQTLTIAQLQSHTIGDLEGGEWS